MSDFSVDPQSVVEFWRDAGSEKWFTADPAFDDAVSARFRDLHERAARGDLDEWAADPTGMLALILLLDQFPRNMFRGTPRAYATDPSALLLSRRSLERGDAATVGEDVNFVLAMPLMHSEDPFDQEAGVDWMERIEPEKLHHAVEHRDIIRRFGRFPHRNEILGRPMRPEEQAFLDGGGFAG